MWRHNEIDYTQIVNFTDEKRYVPFKIQLYENGKIDAKTGDDIYSSYGQPVERVLKDIMGLESVRAPKIEKELEELKKLVDEDKYDTEEFKKKYNNLLEILGNTDEDLFLIDMDIKMKQKVNSNVESK